MNRAYEDFHRWIELDVGMNNAIKAVAWLLGFDKVAIPYRLVIEFVGENPDAVIEQFRRKWEAHPRFKKLIKIIVNSNLDYKPNPCTRAMAGRDDSDPILTANYLASMGHRTHNIAAFVGKSDNWVRKYVTVQFTNDACMRTYKEWMARNPDTDIKETVAYLMEWGYSSREIRAVTGLGLYKWKALVE